MLQSGGHLEAIGKMAGVKMATDSPFMPSDPFHRGRGHRRAMSRLIRHGRENPEVLEHSEKLEKMLRRADRPEWRGVKRIFYIGCGGRFR